MKHLKLLLTVAILFMGTNINAGNYKEKSCVRTYNTMIKYINKYKLHAKAGSTSSMLISFKMAKDYSAEAIVDCNGIREDLHYKAQVKYDELVAIHEAEEEMN